MARGRCWTRWSWVRWEACCDLWAVCFWKIILQSTKLQITNMTGQIRSHDQSSTSSLFITGRFRFPEKSPSLTYLLASYSPSSSSTPSSFRPDQSHPSIPPPFRPPPSWNTSIYLHLAIPTCATHFTANFLRIIGSGDIKQVSKSILKASNLGRPRAGFVVKE